MESNVIICESLARCVEGRLGKSKSFKFIVDGDDASDTTAVSDTMTIIRKLDLLHPVALLQRDICEAIYHTAGSGITSTLVLSALIARRASEILTKEGLPKPILLEGLKNAINLCEEVFEQSIIPLNLLTRSSDAIQPEDEEDVDWFFTSSSPSSSTPKNIDYFSDLIEVLVKGHCRSGPAIQGITMEVAKSIFGKGQQPNGELSLLSVIDEDAISPPIAISQCSTSQCTFPEIGALVCKRGLFIPLSSYSARQHSETMIPLIKSRSGGRWNPLVIDGDLMFGSRDSTLGVNRVIRSIQSDSQDDRRQSAFKLLLSSGYSAVLVRGQTDPVFVEMMNRFGILVVGSLDGQNWDILLKCVASNRHQAVVGHISEIRSRSSSIDICLELYSLDTRYFLCVIPDRPSSSGIASVIIHGSISARVEEAKASMWSCLRRVRNSLSSNGVLPGGGIIEKKCIEALERTADQCQRSARYESHAFRCLSSCLEEFHRRISVSEEDQGEIFDDIRGKTKSYQGAFQSIQMILCSAGEILTNKR